MTKLFVAVLFTISLASAVMAQDPVKVDAKHYTVEFKNAPGARTAYRMARAKVRNASSPKRSRYFMTDANTKFTLPKGDPQPTNNKAGETLWTPVDSFTENTGDQPFEVILVELKSKPVKKAVKKPSPPLWTPKQ
jgi:hypothetical protein